MNKVLVSGNLEVAPSLGERLPGVIYPDKQVSFISLHVTNIESSFLSQFFNRTDTKDKALLIYINTMAKIAVVGAGIVAN
ncbi:hypothetical protein H9L39_09727 [Fusarium oxysporum f. sp. albedinis]|nr:hypothetical protein H9L39_09727 [Fusarium oxysporum f. sp. albedinis]